MKKVLVFILVLSMTMAVNGCGSVVNVKDASDTADSENEVSSKTDAEDDTEGVTDKIADDAAEASTEGTDADYDENVSSISEVAAEAANIKDMFSEHGIKAGTCISQKMIYDPNYSEIITTQFNSVTLENALKPDAILNQSASKKAGDVVVEIKSETKSLLDWAKKNNMSMRGHTLIWHQQTPEWIFHEDFNASMDIVSREVMLERMESFIRQVFTLLDEQGYLDMIYAYDVVNEAFEDNGSMRESLWKQTIGDDYLYWAFYYADKYAPESVDLYYNDYNEQFKYVAVSDFVKSLTDDEGRLLIDGIGLQAHLYTKDNISQYFKAVDTYAATGLKVSLTELDVCLGSYQNKLAPEEVNLQAQGDFYYELISGLLSRKDEGSLNLDGITFWGISDNQSWRSEYYPLLYDKDLNPKYAYDGVMLKKN